MRRITLDEGERRAVASQLLESLCGLSPAEQMTPRTIGQEELKRLNEAIVRINRHEPLQYVLGEAYFFGHRFYVNPSVLIPRPETEELVELVSKELRSVPTLRMADIATGSGCVAISLQLALGAAEVWGTDISAAALQVAERNARTLNSTARFVQHDILGDDPLPGELAALVSNPPYIAESEKYTMERNVVDYEPHLALFVPDEDPLKFYRALALRGKHVLVDGGLLAAELNPTFGRHVAGLMTDHGYLDVKLLKDLAGKDRFISARKGHDPE